ncbi:MAG TPA: 30S ribosomal protein S2 [archaeon]|nr:30S ribosomal protein S2 [archaeon]
MMKKSLLIAREDYLSAGVHIGMTSRTEDMKKFIYKVRPNGLAVLNIGILDARLQLAANMLAEAKNPLIVARKDVAQAAAKKFAETIEARSIIGRFMPGSLTNPTYEGFFEPDLVVITDPSVDRQALKEAVQIRAPVIAFADTSNNTDFIDVIVPCNNKGKKSMALVFWVLAKTILEKRNEGKVQKDEKGESVPYKYDMKLEDFGYEEGKDDQYPQQERRPQGRGRGRRQEEDD